MLSNTNKSNVSRSSSMMESLENRRMFSANCVDTTDAGTMGVSYSMLDASPGKQIGIYAQLDSAWYGTSVNGSDVVKA